MQVTGFGEANVPIFNEQKNHTTRRNELFLPKATEVMSANYRNAKKSFTFGHRCIIQSERNNLAEDQWFG